MNDKSNGEAVGNGVSPTKIPINLQITRTNKQIVVAFRRTLFDSQREGKRF